MWINRVVQTMNRFVIKSEDVQFLGVFLRFSDFRCIGRFPGVRPVSHISFHCISCRSHGGFSFRF